MRTRKNDIALLIVLIVMVTALHYLTINQRWAVHDFYRRLYYIPILLGAFQFRLRGGVITGIAVTLLYLPHVIFILGVENIVFINQLLEMIMFLFIGSMAGYLVEQLYRNNLLLTDQLERITEIEILNENILNSMSYPLIALDNNNMVKIINNAAKRYFVDLKTDDLFFEYQKDIFDEIHIAVERVVNGTLHRYDEILHLQLNLKPLVYHVKIFSLKNQNDDIMGTVISLEDITEVYQLEAEIRRSDKLSAIGVMASGVAHEIRNPLGIIKSIAQTIKASNKLNEMDTEGMEIIISEVDRANGVIKEILDFSKIERGVLININLNELVHDVIKITHNFVETSLVTIVTEIAPDISCLVDVGKMKQVFMNLIMNAVDAMPNGGFITIKGNVRDKKVIISVSDNGMGISKEKIDNIFNPFYTTKDSGTGLGLSITHKIIKEHNGTIRVNSTLGIGTEFLIELPNNSEVEYEI